MPIISLAPAHSRHKTSHIISPHLKSNAKDSNKSVRASLAGSPYLTQLLQLSLSLKILFSDSRQHIVSH